MEFAQTCMCAGADQVRPVGITVSPGLASGGLGFTR